MTEVPARMCTSSPVWMKVLTPSSDKKMGDHPVIWTNTRFPARNVYIFMGHSPDLFQNEAYKTLFRNAIFWAAGK